MSSTTSPAATERVSLTIKSDEEHAKKGPEGTWHDAYLPAEFTVKPGATVEVTVHNYDEATHTFTSTGLGTNQMIAAGSATKPATTTFTFKAPTKTGSYEWHCMMPCDPWAMSHTGFMKGAVTVA
jgi:plastocyanin